MTEGDGEVLVEGRVLRCGIENVYTESVDYLLLIDGAPGIHRVNAARQTVLALTAPGDVVRVAVERAKGPMIALKSDVWSIRNVTTGSFQRIRRYEVEGAPAAEDPREGPMYR